MNHRFPAPVRDELVRQTFKGFTTPRSQEQCTHLPSLSHSVSHPGLSGGVSFSVGRVGCGAWGWRLESGETFLTPTHPLFLPLLQMSELWGFESQTAISALSRNPLYHSNKYHRYNVSDRSQARNMQPTEEVHVMF